MAPSQRPRRERRDRRASQAGQSLVEFSLVIPLFLVVLMGVIEFLFLMNGQLSINYATRDAALIAAEAGNAGRTHRTTTCRLRDPPEGRAGRHRTGEHGQHHAGPDLLD